MNKFIKVTKFSNKVDDNESIYLNTSYIESVTKSASNARIDTINAYFIVKESVEEVMNLINA